MMVMNFLRAIVGFWPRTRTVHSPIPRRDPCHGSPPAGAVRVGAWAAGPEGVRDIGEWIRGDMDYESAVLWAIECHRSGVVGEVSIAVPGVGGERRGGVTRWRKTPDGPVPVERGA